MDLPRELEERLAFLRVERADVELLRELRPTLEKHADTFVAAFYRHLLSFAPTRELLRDPEVKQRLLVAQRAYFLSLGEPSFDAGYLERRRQIGRTHERIGLVPRFYVGAYGLYSALVAPLVFEAFAHDADRAMRTMAALQKLLMLDAAIALDTYVEQHEQQLTYLTRELEREGRRLGSDYERQGAELRRTEERARTAEQLASIATLVAGLAHEIGTPMGVIQGHAKLLEPAVRDPDARWRLETIQAQITRISRIIQTLLNMARPSRSRRQPVALRPLLETTLSFVTEKLARRDIRLESEYEDVPSVTGDPERLQQLFLNLFLNAADAMPDGGTLRVELAAGPDGGVRVLVRDTGMGIPPADLERIFEPFFTTKPAGQGSGLGLMVARGIAGDHGGRLEVESEVGRGTEFCVSLPLPEASAQAPRA
jgi:signal transduction histidine kinase